MKVKRKRAGKVLSLVYVEALERALETAMILRGQSLFVTWCECGHEQWAATWYSPRLGSCSQCLMKAKTKQFGEAAQGAKQQ